VTGYFHPQLVPSTWTEDRGEEGERAGEGGKLGSIEPFESVLAFSLGLRGVGVSLVRKY